RLTAVEFQGTAGVVAEEPPPPAVGRNIDVLVDIRAVEPERVEAGLILDRVVAVARVPDERVVARAEEGHVVAGAAVDKIIALAAEDRVGAGTTIDGQCHGTGNYRRSVDRVV